MAGPESLPLSPSLSHPIIMFPFQGSKARPFLLEPGHLRVVLFSMLVCNRLVTRKIVLTAVF